MGKSTDLVEVLNHLLEQELANGDGVELTLALGKLIDLVKTTDISNEDVAIWIWDTFSESRGL